jgi:hypothetical protein
MLHSSTTPHRNGTEAAHLARAREHDHQDDQWGRSQPVQDRGVEQPTDGIEAREPEHQSHHHREDDHVVEAARFAEPPGESLVPVHRFGDRVGGRSRQHRHREQPEPHHAHREDDAGEIARERLQCPRGLFGGLHLGDSVAVERDCRRHHDRECH